MSMRMRIRVVGMIILGLLFTPAVAVNAQEQKAENSAVKPMPRDEKWVKRHEGFVAMAQKGNIDVLFLGDSITDAWGGEGHKGAGSKIFAKEFERLKTANFGIGGDRTQHV